MHQCGSRDEIAKALEELYAKDEKQIMDEFKLTNPLPYGLSDRKGGEAMKAEDEDELLRQWSRRFQRQSVGVSEARIENE